MASGVLGCYNEPNDEVTMIQGWNWYAGTDPSQIGAGQYDFETTVLHELGHALGLGGSTDPNSPMFETLAPGVAHRTVTTQDLNIPDPPEGADPQRAAGFPPSSPAGIHPVQPGSGSSVAVGSLAGAPLDNTMAARESVLTGWSPIHAGATKRVVAPSDALRSSRVLGSILPVPAASRKPVLDASLVEALLGDLTSTWSLLDLKRNGHAPGKRSLGWRF
jgi:hypothetical protein